MAKIKFINILKTSEEVKEKVRHWRNRKDIKKYMLNQHIIQKKEHQAWLDMLTHTNNAIFWVVFFMNIPVGAAYLQNINHKKFSTEWGFYIGQKDYRGRGLGKYILLKLMKKVFEEMKLRILTTKVLSNNLIARNLYESLNFKKKRQVKAHKNTEIIFYEFTKHNWKTSNRLSNII